MNRTTILTIPMDEKQLSEVICSHIVTTWDNADFRVESASKHHYAVEIIVHREAVNEVDGNAVTTAIRDQQRM